MSGHSKWSTIKHKKGATDAKRGKVFTKLIREITIATRGGGADMESNPRLRTAIFRARSENMPKDNIDRAIKKGAGTLDGIEFIEFTYEAYAHGGVGLLIETLTDNKNRTTSNVKSLLTRSGGQMAAIGSVSYQFKRMGIILVNTEHASEDQIMELILEFDVHNIFTENNVIEIQTELQTFEEILKNLEKNNIPIQNAEITMISDANVLLDKDKCQKVLDLIEKIEEDDDVQNVFTNLEIPANMNFQT